MDAGQISLEIDDTDIPGAHLDEVLKAHNVTGGFCIVAYKLITRQEIQ